MQHEICRGGLRSSIIAAAAAAAAAACFAYGIISARTVLRLNMEREDRNDRHSHHPCAAASSVSSPHVDAPVKETPRAQFITTAFDHPP